MLKEVPTSVGMTNVVGGKEIPAFAGIVMQNRIVNDANSYSIFVFMYFGDCNFDE